MLFPKKQLSSLFAGLTLCFIPIQAHAICAGTPHNPLTEVCYQCMFPFKIAGVTVARTPTDTPDAPDAASAPVCVCPISVPPFFRIGISVSFWEPARFVEVVKDAYCFPSIGVGLVRPMQGS